jgi:crotonobetaine/carnitine-CoA ligase
VLDRDLVLPHLIARRAKEDAHRPFVQHVDGASLTFAELHEAALSWAGVLQAEGVTAGDRVVVMLPPCFDAITAWLGTAWLRAIEVPLHTAYRGRMLEYTITNSQAKVAILHREFLPRIAEVFDQLPSDLRVVVVGGEGQNAGPTAGGRPVEDLRRSAPAPRDLLGPERHDISSILYTSGTTGPSKGVMVPWAQAHATATGCIPLEPLGEDDAWYSPYPLFHASGKIPVYAMALVRGRVVIRERFHGPSFWPDIEAFGCTTTMMIGATAGYIADQRRQLGVVDSPLRHVLVSPPPADPVAFEAEFGVRICSTFNMTEISAPISTEWRPMTDRTCGKVRPGYECRIVDPHDQEQPDGTPGELIVRSDEPWRLMAGYWNMPEKTAEAWRNGWFHTGDVCLRDERGEFFFIDRVKDAIRRRGENISSMEVEVVVIEHPGVHECAAFGVPAAGGEEEVKIAIVVADPAAFDPEELIAFLIPRMPRFMVPRYVEVLDALPRTSTEKVRKDELRDRGLDDGTWDRRAAGLDIAR